ncbi:hypothetical protein ID866_8462 [Astraeus odoratus]|nr:hypothetical protein ID866_8462 [Astraeus odoratus]
MLPDFGHHNSVYTSHYCEENVYLLVQRALSAPDIHKKWEVYAVFISNPTKTVALWQQRAAGSRDKAVIWDYHVILALRGPMGSVAADNALEPDRGAWIYDLDTFLPVPCHWQEVRSANMQPLLVGGDVDFCSLFRVVPGKEYLDNFASDRSHMIMSDLSQGPHYIARPPSCPCICGPLAAAQGVRHNLMSHFVPVCGDVRGFGTVMNFESFLAWCMNVEVST